MFNTFKISSLKVMTIFCNVFKVPSFSIIIGIDIFNIIIPNYYVPYIHYNNKTNKFYKVFKGSDQYNDSINLSLTIPDSSNISR